MDKTRLTLTVRLWLNGNDLRAFEAFEAKVAGIMSKHGGRIEHVIRPDRSDDSPFEIHTVTFPDEQSFAAYRNDPESMALAAEREQVIARTEISRLDTDQHG